MATSPVRTYFAERAVIGKLGVDVHIAPDPGGTGKPSGLSVARG